MQSRKLAAVGGGRSLKEDVGAGYLLGVGNI